MVFGGVEMIPDFDDAFNHWLSKCREIVQADGRGEMGYDLTYSEGRKYIKVIMTVQPSNPNHNMQRSSWAFIDKTNGDVLKCASWKAPAKHARGNLMDEFDGLQFIQWTGPMYLDTIRR
tara:strand:- start:18 stop:374 length:357 start_codon:yes stop_codon:yes gene_type:complete